MGIDINTARFLLWTRKHGVDFSSTVTLGRQHMLLRPSQLEKAARGLSMDGNVSLSALAAAARSMYGDSFFECLGARDVQSIDASGYEQATIIHDMNLPIQSAREYSCVFDGGTLEHVFNVRTSFENCMRLVRVGGHVLHVLPSNNFFGHGFYQFSAEFFYRLYGAENGFEVRKLLLVEDCPGGKWLDVPDPSRLKRRIVFSNSLPTNVFVLARKLAQMSGISKIPQQSDYEELSWIGRTGSVSRHALLRDFVRNSLPGAVGRVLLTLKHWTSRNRDIMAIDIDRE